MANGQTYILVDGDLEFVAGQDPTNVGGYQVQLSDQGKRNIEKVDSTHYTYDFSNAGTGIFTITKATPTVVFNGVGSRTYGQNDTNWTTPTGLIITAPSNPTIALTAEDYEFVGADGTVYTSIPTNVGTYTVRLSAKGKSLITGSTVNSANLDWANANISGTGTFTVKAAEAKAELSGTNSRDYNGSAVTTADINNGGTIAVTISIPNSTKNISYKLQDDDYTWKDNANTTNVGTYTIELNKANILAHLQDAIKGDNDWNGNVTLADTALSGTATFTVNAKAANVSLSGNNGNGVTYNGSVVSTPLDALKNALSASGTINNAKLDLTGLTTAGFDWYDAAGTNKISAPTDHGTYTIKLNDTGLQQIQDKNSNYTVSIATPNAYTFKINTAKGSVALGGDRSVTYGTDDSTSYFSGYTATLTTNPSTITGFAPSFTLQAGDLQFSSDGRTWTTTVPTAVGTYQVKLSDAARNIIVQDNSANGNIDWPATGFTGVKNYTVTPAQATASLSGSAKRPYNGSAVTTADINNTDSTIGVTIKLPNNKTTTYKLVDGDYTWVDSSAPTNVGTYQLKFNLTEQGKTNLQNWLNKADDAGTGLDGKPNVTAPTKVTGTASFEITPVAITVTQSGSGSKTYDGNAANVPVGDLTNSNNWSATGMIGGQSFNLPSGLALGDFDWYKVNADNSETKLNDAPTDAGDYELKLNNDGLKKLQDANKNYSFSYVSGSYIFTINSKVTFEFVDDDNKNAQGNPTVVGTPQSQGMQIGKETTISPALKVPDNYQLAQGQELPTTYTAEKNDPVVQIHLVHQRHAVDQTYDVVRTIEIYDDAGKLVDEIEQTASIFRTVTTDEVTGKVTYGDWSTAQLPAYTPAPKKGYTVDPTVIAAEDVTSNTPATQTVEVHYTKNAPTPVSDSKTITETIHYRYADGSQAAPDKVVNVTFTRSGEQDAVTDVITWGAWTPTDEQIFPAVVSPTIKGYTPDQAQIDDQTVNPTSNNLTFTVTYSKQSDIAVSDSKTITETIHYRYADGSQAAPDQVVHLTYTRQGMQDPVTDAITWGAWTPAGDQSFPAVVSPTIAGYTSDQAEIDEQTINRNSADLEFTVTYNANSKPDQPGTNPGGNGDSGTDTNPGGNGENDTNPTPSDHGQIVGPNGTVYPSGSYYGPDGSIYGPDGMLLYNANAHHQAAQLPQTGNEKNSLSVVGLLAAGLTGLFGLGGIKKKQD